MTSKNRSLGQATWVALGIGAAGVALASLAWSTDPAAFYSSWLFASLYWLDLSLGCLAILMIHRLTGGEWGRFIEPVLRSGAAALPVMALAFILLLFGLEELYVWTEPASTLPKAVQKKLAYLNVDFFQLRTLVYFAIWILLALLMRVWHRPEHVETLAASRAAAGLILYTLAITFFSFDWVMSLDPEFYSTILGAIVGVGQVLAAFALIVLVGSQVEPWRSAAHGTRNRQDLGNLLMAFLLLWVYMAFSQLLIIWSADLPHEIRFYVQRIEHGWLGVGILVALFHFALPFAALISRWVKRSRKTLALIAGTVLVTHVLDVWWLVMPALRTAAWHVTWLDVVSFAGVGGLWLAVFFWRLVVARRQPIVATGQSAEAAL